MPKVPDRLARKIERSGEHEVWTGATDSRGIGLVSLNGRTTTVRRVVWESAHGELLDGLRVVGTCEGGPSCVRLDHLALAGLRSANGTKRKRSRRGRGSIRQIAAGRWELRITVGRWDDGSPRTLYRNVRSRTRSQAEAELASFVEEMTNSQQPDSRELRDITMDQAVERFLAEHLTADKGRSEKTVNDYRRLHQRWFSPTIGDRTISRVDTATMDRIFGEMRQAGLSASRLNHAKSLYAPFFRWARRRGMITRDPMTDFEMPISTYRSKERRPPEIEELVLLLSTAVDVVPDIAPLLVLGAVTGMRRGELVGIRRSAISWKRNSITVDSAVAESGRLKETKTHVSRRFHVDAETIQMLWNHCARMDELAEAAGVELCPDPFLFSLGVDCSTPLPPDHFTRRVATLKGHLGIEEKRPDVIALEDEALRLRRLPARPRSAGKPGPCPDSGMSFREIGEILGRSGRWAAFAVQAADRREAARDAGHGDLDFDGSIVALRKFTSSELLDAGFNISVVAHRQGHGTQVLARHYSKSRDSADKRAADHLGRLVHGQSG